MRHSLTTDEREKRVKARDEIIQAANHHIVQHAARYGYMPVLLGPRNIHRAVKIVRQNLLVRGKTLIDAGYKPPVLGGQGRKPTVLRKLLGE